MVVPAIYRSWVNAFRERLPSRVTLLNRRMKMLFHRDG